MPATFENWADALELAILPPNELIDWGLWLFEGYLCVV
jgi:hypothetical protein